MRKGILAIWASLMSTLSALNGEATRTVYYRTIAGWIRDHESDIPGEVWESYGLATLADLCVDEHAIEFSEQEVSADIARLREFEPKSMDNIAMLLRDRLWNMAAFKTDRDCPSCGDDELRVLFDQDSVPPRHVLACDTCGWAQWPDGRKWTGRPTVRPATLRELEEGGFQVPS